MNRNTESRFAVNPTNIDISRSRFDRSHSLKTSFNVGDVVPILVEEVLPGDTFNLKTHKVVRLQTLITPVMDNIYLDTYYFFVPNRLTWNHWKEFNGENTQSAWIPDTDYAVPQLVSPSGGWSVGTIADYMGIPTGVANLSVNALPFRAYSLIINDWFRDENLSDPLHIPVDDSTVIGVNTGDYVSDCAKGGLPFKAAKYFDYFTSCLPGPQKGPDVTIDIASGTVPVTGNGYTLGISNGSSLGGLTGAANTISSTTIGRFGNSSSSFGLAVGSTSSFNGNAGDKLTYGVPTLEQLTDHPEYSGLVANLGSAPVVTINQLRTAFQIQKLYEKDARGGTRYIEVIKSHFGVTSPDARQQRPEYLGGNRTPLNINQVIQQSATTSGGTAQGTTTAMSVTADSHYDFTKSFTEHGFIIGLCVARYDHTYQQGLDRFWSRKTRFDYYWPVLANIGEMAVKNKEIYAQGSSVLNPDTGKPYDEEVFGYQEAWADYRYKPNHVTGEMRSSYAQSLDSWHLGDDYDTMPSLSDSWIREDKTNVDRVLAVTSSVSNQLFGDFYIENKATRPMPMYSIPGLIDHH